ncbi:hypothetical protein BDQ17DRAFT_1332787 [Cyathus striatus]|nr:hypothetical protein BDQ17DRAFT_1332787 [Cyathus striatus]
MPMQMSPNVTLKDNVPNVLTNAHADLLMWNQAGVSGLEYNGTTTHPNATGAMATFNFIGTSVSLYGTLAFKSSALKVQYTIDETVFLMTNYSSYPSDAYQILLFEQWNMAASNHSLIITILPGSDINYYLDYLDYTPIESPITTITMESGSSGRGRYVDLYVPQVAKVENMAHIFCTKMVPFELSESVSVDPTLHGEDHPPSYTAALYDMAAVQVAAPLFQA